MTYCKSKMVRPSYAEHQHCYDPAMEKTSSSSCLQRRESVAPSVIGASFVTKSVFKNTPAACLFAPPTKAQSDYMHWVSHDEGRFYDSDYDSLSDDEIPIVGGTVQYSDTDGKLKPPSEVTSNLSFAYLSESYDTFMRTSYIEKFFGKASNYEEKAHIIINLYLNLSNCHNRNQFLYAIFTFYKDMCGISYGKFLRKYEKNILFFVTFCFQLNFDKVETPDDESAPTQAQSGKVRDFLKNVRELVKNYKRIIKSEFGNKFSYFCALVLSTPFAEKLNIDSTWFGFSETWDKRFKSRVHKDNKFDLVAKTMDTTAYLLDKMIDYAETGDKTCIYIDDEEEKRYEKDYMLLQHYSDRLNQLANVDMDLDDYLNRCDSTMELGKRLKGLYTKDKLRSAALQSQQSALARYKLRAMDKLNVCSERAFPLSFCVYSAPGCGKSDFTKMLYHTIYENAIYLGVSKTKFDPSKVYHVNEDDDFMSEFKMSHEIAHMDDVDQYVDKIVLQKNGGMLSKSIMFANCVPYVTPQANLEDKGMIPFRCKIISYTTNTHDMGRSAVFKEGGGAFRRTPTIEISVKKQYCRPGETQMHGDQSEEGYKNHDLWDIRYWKYEQVGFKHRIVYWDPDQNKFVHTQASVGKNNKKNEPITSGVRPMSFAEFSVFFREYVQKPHYQQHDLAKKSFEHFVNSEICPKHGYLNSLCGCKEVEGGVDPLPEDKKEEEETPEDADIVFSPTEGQSETPDFETEEQAYVWVLLSAQKFWYTFIFPLYISYVYFLLFMHFLVGRFKSKYEPNYFTHLFMKRVRNMWSYEDLPWWFKYTPNFVMSHLVCEGWFFRAKQISYDYYHGPVAQTSRKIGRKIAAHKYGIATMLLTFTALGCIYRMYRKATCATVGQTETVAAKKDVWKQHFVPVTRMTGAPSTCTYQELVDACRNNVLKVIARTTKGEFTTNAFAISGTKVIMPKHFMKEIQDSFPVHFDILRAERTTRLNCNRYNILVDRANFHLINSNLTNDIVVFQHNSLQPFRDLTKFLLSGPCEGKTKGNILIRNTLGQLYLHPFTALRKNYVHYYTPSKEYIVLRDGQAYAAFTDTPTNPGDCGAPYIVQTQNGNFIAGIHIAGGLDTKVKQQKVECHAIFGTDVNIDRFQPLSFNGIDLNHTYQHNRDLRIEPRIHPKDPCNNVEGVAELFGTMPEYNRRKMKSAVGRPLCAEDAKQHFNLLKYEFDSPASINTPIATEKNIQPMCEKPTFAQSTVDKMEDHLYNMWLGQILKIEKETGVSFPDRPYDIDVGINGLDGVPYVDRIPVSTSTGFPYGGPKLNHLIEVPSTEGHAVRYKLDEQCQRNYDLFCAAYDKGETADVVFDSCFKDEPHTLEKLEENKCRIFNSGPVAFNVLCRQLFLPFIPYFSGKYRHFFGMAIGANSSGKDWKVLYDYLIQHGLDRIIAGDYSKFDKRMTAQIMTAVMNVMIRIAKYFMWPAWAIKYMYGIASQACYPLTNIFGLVVRFDGSNPSGWPLTTILNGGCNIMYIMIGCYDVEKSLKISTIDYNKFFEVYCLLTYGDDNIGGVSKDYPHLTHTSISSALAVYGVVFTMADKKSKSVPLINIKDADFLKRRFVPGLNHPDTVAAPLDEKSIRKMLTCITISKAISLEEQTAAVIESANREWFQHGKEVFEREHAFLQSLVNKHQLHGYLSNCVLPGYDHYYTRMLEDYGITMAQSGFTPIPTVENDQSGWLHFVNAMSSFEDDSDDEVELYREQLRRGRLLEKYHNILSHVDFDHKMLFSLCLIELGDFFTPDLEDMSIGEDSFEEPMSSDDDDEKENNSSLANCARRSMSIT